MVQVEEFEQRIVKMSDPEKPQLPQLTPEEIESIESLVQMREGERENMPDKSVGEELKEIGEATGRTPQKESDIVEPEKRKPVDAKGQKTDDVPSVLLKPKSDWTLEDVNDAIQRGYMGNDVVLYYPSNDARDIMRFAINRCQYEDAERFSQVVPDGEYVVMAGIEFQLATRGPEVKYPQDFMELTVAEFIKYQVVDWELACLFNNDLPYNYRDGERIATFYSLMQEEQMRHGKLSNGTHMERFVKLQFHLS